MTIMAKYAMVKLSNLMINGIFPRSGARGP